MPFEIVPLTVLWRLQVEETGRGLKLHPSVQPSMVRLVRLRTELLASRDLNATGRRRSRFKDRTGGQGGRDWGRERGPEEDQIDGLMRWASVRNPFTSFPCCCGWFLAVPHEHDVRLNGDDRGHRLGVDTAHGIENRRHIQSLAFSCHEALGITLPQVVVAFSVLSDLVSLVSFLNVVRICWQILNTLNKFFIEQILHN